MPKKPTCKNCGVEFKKWYPLQRSCSPKCEAELVNKRKAAREERAKIYAKPVIKVSDHKIYMLVSRFVKLRDWGKPCISCGAPFQADFHAGHYHGRGAHPELKFELFNIHGQCAHCNIELDGNKKGYIRGIKARYGEEKAQELHDMARTGAGNVDLEFLANLESRNREMTDEIKRM